MRDIRRVGCGQRIQHFIDANNIACISSQLMNGLLILLALLR
jgi:hypothetical protein